jgi:hypothetical protein
MILPVLGFSQRAQLQLGTQVPLNYSLGIEYKLFPDRLSGNMQFGLLTAPYHTAILELLKAFGTDEAIVNTIGEAFSSGLILQPSLKYHWKNNYTGLTYSHYALTANDAPTDAIETYYGMEIPGRNRRQNEITLTSGLHNAGIFYGIK